MLAELAAVTAASTLLARDSLRGGATASGTALALLVAALAVFPSLAIVRAQLFSLALFPALVAILRSEARSPSRRIWVCVPLLALWSNLHGAALVGLGIALLYLALNVRSRPATAIAVGLASCAAMCLTPAGLRTIDYYQGTLTNVAAQRGWGLWVPLQLSSPFDVLLVACALLLAGSAAYAWRGRPPLWELVSSVALAGLTIQTSRSGIWLVAFLVPPAARGLSLRRARRSGSASVAAIAVALIAVAVVRGPLDNGASQRLVDQAISLAHGSPILATDIAAEQVALAGGGVWVSNPIDAFSKEDQAIYLDWIQGTRAGRQALRRDVRVVIVTRGSPAQRLMAQSAGFAAIASDARNVVYLRAGQRFQPSAAGQTKR
jgi:hypothetical protein